MNEYTIYIYLFIFPRFFPSVENKRLRGQALWSRGIRLSLAMKNRWKKEDNFLPRNKTTLLRAAC